MIGNMVGIHLMDLPMVNERLRKLPMPLVIHKKNITKCKF
jgi:hypothetical protein